MFIISQEFGFLNSPVYEASKSGLVPLTKFLAFDSGQRNVMLNVIFWKKKEQYCKYTIIFGMFFKFYNWSEYFVDGRWSSKSYG